MNDDMARGGGHPDRIRWFASLPWQHPELAVEELARTRRSGVVGVTVLANVDGRSLTEPAFASIRQAIEDAALPVLVHPTAPPGVSSMDMSARGLVPPVGFVFDRTLAIARIL